MGNCRICQASMPQYQTFCSCCGARQTSVPASGSARGNVLTRLKDYFREVFRSDTEKRFDAAIPSLEEIINLEPENPRFRGILTVFYAGAGDERLSHPMGFPGGPIEELRPKYSFFSGEMRPNTKAEEIFFLSFCTYLGDVFDEEF